MKNIELLRDGNHKSVLVLIPGTMEQIQAENLALRELMRNMQMGEGGARIKIPECPVIENLSSNIFEFRCVLKRWHLRSKSSNVSMATLCVDHAGLAFRHKALLFPFISWLTYSVLILLQPRRCAPSVGTTWLEGLMTPRRCWGPAFSDLKCHQYFLKFSYTM